MNVGSPSELEALFFRDKSRIEQIMKDNKAIVFHCEFSQKRGPAMYRTLRELDRNLHLSFYPQVFYTEIYLLEGGYQRFYNEFPHYCDGGYVPMLEE
mmetsp:Transcript_152/g.113  ORF Transcript_152/g.113 Transcript_152/m.113 type:complete len:97 (+) Transcript_152:230-520(+)